MPSKFDFEDVDPLTAVPSHFLPLPDKIEYEQRPLPGPPPLVGPDRGRSIMQSFSREVAPELDTPRASQQVNQPEYDWHQQQQAEIDQLVDHHVQSLPKGADFPPLYIPQRIPGIPAEEILSPRPRYGISKILQLTGQANLEHEPSGHSSSKKIAQLTGLGSTEEKNGSSQGAPGIYDHLEVSDDEDERPLDIQAIISARSSPCSSKYSQDDATASPGSQMSIQSQMKQHWKNDSAYALSFEPDAESYFEVEQERPPTHYSVSPTSMLYSIMGKQKHMTHDPYGDELFITPSNMQSMPPESVAESWTSSRKSTPNTTQTSPADVANATICPSALPLPLASSKRPDHAVAFDTSPVEKPSKSRKVSFADFTGRRRSSGANNTGQSIPQRRRLSKAKIPTPLIPGGPDRRYIAPQMTPYPDGTTPLEHSHPDRRTSDGVEEYTPDATPTKEYAPDTTATILTRRASRAKRASVVLTNFFGGSTGQQPIDSRPTLADITSPAKRVLPNRLRKVDGPDTPYPAGLPSKRISGPTQTKMPPPPPPTAIVHAAHLLKSIQASSTTSLNISTAKGFLDQARSIAGLKTKAEKRRLSLRGKIKHISNEAVPEGMNVVELGAPSGQISPPGIGGGEGGNFF